LPGEGVNKEMAPDIIAAMTSATAAILKAGAVAAEANGQSGWAIVLNNLKGKNVYIIDGDALAAARGSPGEFALARQLFALVGVRFG